MKRLAWVLAFCGMGVVSTEVEAQMGGVFLEPLVSYELGSSSVNYPSPLSSSTGSINGAGIGGRLGIHIQEIVFFGVDARYSAPYFIDAASSYSASATSTNWGPVVGVQVPLLGLRFWGSYVLGGSLDPLASGNLDVKFQDVTGYRLGVGWSLLLLSLNLEYQQIRYEETTLEKAGPFPAGTSLENVSLDNKGVVVSVSLPLEF